MTTMQIDRAVVQQALEALKLSTPRARPVDDDYAEQGWKEHNAAITDLRVALAQQPRAMAQAYEAGYNAGVAAEREACARACEDLWKINAAATECAAAIRARGNT